MTKPAHRNRESGYALLFIYAMAAILAMMLLMAMPRVAFEAQRDKEQLLVDRGEQYSRAIALYVRKFNTYPADIKALDNTQNLRFLRNHYVDPMTGKDEWRLIHVGPGGVFTDSLVYNQKKTTDQGFAAQNFIMELGQTGGNQTDPNQSAVNLATRLRPSDTPGAPVDPNSPQSGLLPLQPDGTQPGAPPSGNPISVPAGLAQLPQYDVNGQPIPNTGTTSSGFPPQAQPGVNGLPQGVQLPPGLPMPPGTPNPLTGPNGAGSPTGTSLINQLLTTPRPGGLAGLNGANGANGANGSTGQPAVDQNGNPIPAANQTAGAAMTTGQVVGGGLAGVASKREQQGIKLYNDKKKYNEWEFVYDITKDPTRSGGAVPTPAQGQLGQPGQPGQQPQGQSPFGATQPQQPSQPTTPTTPAPSQ